MPTTTPDAFDALLATRDELEAAHTDLCREINSSRLSESSLEAQWRDAAWQKLMAVQSKIDAVIADERANELEGA